MPTMIDNYQGHPIEEYDSDRVEETASAAARAFLADPQAPLVVELQPGNGTRYCMVFTPLVGGAAKMVGNDWLLSFPDYKVCYPVNIPGHQVPSYVQDKWLKGLADAVPVSQFLISMGKKIREWG